MLTLYFSGTDNSAFVARQLADGLGGACRSIEENAEFSALIQSSDTIAFVYPIYVSRIPRIMREFVAAHRGDLHGKQLVIVCTQMRFSGDGARCFTDLLDKNSYTVLYAEHVTMPNNVSNMPFFHPQDAQTVRRIVEDAKRQVNAVCADIKAGRVVKRCFNIGSRLLGLTQAFMFPLMEKAMGKNVRISDACNGCGWCVQHCPTHNLKLENGKATAGKNCTLCYRCLNGCPQRAVNLYFKGKVKWQYQGIKIDK